eukprot:3894449-Rhodomonas_salina.1
MPRKQEPPPSVSGDFGNLVGAMILRLSMITPLSAIQLALHYFVTTESCGCFTARGTWVITTSLHGLLPCSRVASWGPSSTM